MIYLARSHYRKTRHFKYQNETYWPISPFGDGNCGLYAFACGLIDSILNKELTIEDDKFNKFIRYIKEFSSILHRPFELNDNIELDISKFLKLIHRPNLTFDKFKNFFIDYALTRDSVIAFNLICNQALRHIGFESYTETLINIPEEDKILSQNCIYVGEDILTPLANYFGIHVKLIFLNCPGRNAPSLDNKIATFSLLLKGSHWHYLLPIEQTLGLANILPLEQKLGLANTLPSGQKLRLANILSLEQKLRLAAIPSANKQRRNARQLSHSEVKIDTQKPLEIEDKKNQAEKTRRISRELLHSNEKLIHEMETIYVQKQTDFTATATILKRFSNKFKELFDSLKRIFNEESEATILKRLANNFKKIFDNFKKIFNEESDQTPEFKDAVKQAKTAATQSTQTINSWREEWHIDNNQDENALDRNLNDLGLYLELEKELIKRPFTTDTLDDPAIEADPALAAILQNANIADFLSRNYTILKTCIPSLPTNNCSADIRDYNQSVMAHDQRIAALCISV